MLVLVSLAPLLLAWWFLRHPEYRAEGANHGVLISPPRAVPDQALLTSGDAPVRTLHGRWSLVYPLPTHCAKACHRSLYLLHQVEQALGKDSLRVQRIVYPAGKAPAWPGQWRPERPDALLSRLHGKGHIYLLDPLGNLMMYYRQDFDPKGLMGDLRRLLRTSRIG